MKKVITILVMLTLTLGIVTCGKKDGLAGEALEILNDYIDEVRSIIKQFQFVKSVDEFKKADRAWYKLGNEFKEQLYELANKYDRDEYANLLNKDQDVAKAYAKARSLEAEVREARENASRSFK